MFDWKIDLSAQCVVGVVFGVGAVFQGFQTLQHGLYRFQALVARDADASGFTQRESQRKQYFVLAAIVADDTTAKTAVVFAAGPLVEVPVANLALVAQTVFDPIGLTGKEDVGLGRR